MGSSLCLHLRVSAHNSIFVYVDVLNKYDSLVETNVAIMVSSMPAASGIMRRHFRQSSLYRSFHKSNFSSNDDGSTNRQTYFQNNNPPSSLFYAHNNSRSVKPKFDRTLSLESLRRPNDLEMEMGEQQQYRMENIGLGPPGGGIIRTIQIDQASFNDTAIK
jgi:hypothetical protein